jgi:hypothetical protein
LREPGGTPIGEEVRHTLKHSERNHAMTAEAELLLMNASRAQLVREVIRPALAAGELVLCDRFYDSTIAYQGYGTLSMDTTGFDAQASLLDSGKRYGTARAAMIMEPIDQSAPATFSRSSTMIRSAVRLPIPGTA